MRIVTDFIFNTSKNPFKMNKEDQMIDRVKVSICVGKKKKKTVLD